MMFGQSAGIKKGKMASVVGMINNKTANALLEEKANAMPNQQDLKLMTKKLETDKSKDTLVATEGGLNSTESKMPAKELSEEQKFWENADEFIEKKTNEYKPLTQEELDQKLRDEIPDSVSKIEKLLAHAELQEKYENLAKTDGISEKEKAYYTRIAEYHQRNSAMYTRDTPEAEEHRRETIYNALTSPGTTEDKVFAMKDAVDKLKDGGYFEYQQTKINIFEVQTDVSDKLWTDEFRALSGNMKDMTATKKQEALKGILNSWKEIGESVGVKIADYSPKSAEELNKFELSPDKAEREKMFAQGGIGLDEANTVVINYGSMVTFSGKTLDMYA